MKTKLATLLLPVLALVPPASAQDPAADPLAVPVLEQAGRTYTARELFEAYAPYDTTLAETLERDAQYRAVYFRSLRFLHLVQAYSDHLLLDAAEVPAATAEARLAEAAAWSRDRGLRTPAEGALVAHGFEIDNRARLLARLEPEYSTQELRTHMLSSVPEFFHELAVSWIRLPLFDAAEQRALDQEERREVYETLAAAADAVGSGEKSWEEAVEEYSVIPDDAARNGYVGLLKRTMVGRYEEALLRQTFAYLGYKMPEGHVLRGPIMAENFAYLVRIETIRVRPIVDLNLVRDRVDRSLREKLLQEEFQQLRSGAERRLLVPAR